jgi:hypothetical protein
MELTIRDKAVIRCKLDNNFNYNCKDCEIENECNSGSNYMDFAKELLARLDIKWIDK